MLSHILQADAVSPLEKQKVIDFLQNMPYIRPKIYCFFKNLAVNHFTFTAFHFAVKFANRQRILGPPYKCPPHPVDVVALTLPVAHVEGNHGDLDVE